MADFRRGRAHAGGNPARGAPAVAEPLEVRRLLAASVTGLTLFNADTDQPVPGFVLENGSVIDFRQTGRRLNIRADVAGTPGSVRFNYDANPAYRVEGGAPYAIGGDAGPTDYSAWTPAPGTHTLVVTPYDTAGGTGARGGSRAVTFTVVDTTTPAAPVRVNAGGPAYAALDGRAFAADVNFTGGSKLAGTFAVAGTGDDALYRTRREGSSFTFSKGVPNDTYLVTLHFAEPTKTARGQRKFDVSAEGKLALNDFDVFAAAGTAKAAVARTLTVPVADGRLNLSFAGVVSSAIVSAVEVVPAPRVPAVPAPVRVNAGGGRYVDTLGRSFEPDAGFAGGAIGQSSYDVLLAPENGAVYPDGPYAYDDDALMLSHRTGSSFTFARPVANGNYAVWLEFAEPVAGRAAGQRVFDVSAEGALVLDNYDVVADAGAAQLAVGKTFNVSVRDGRLDLAFRGVVGEAIVSAVVAVPTDIPAAALPYAEVSSSTDPARRAAQETARLVRSAATLRRIGQAAVVHANEYKGRYPADLATLVIRGHLDYPSTSSARAASALALPRGELSRLEQAAWADASRDYVYLGAGKMATTVSATDWLAYENPDRVPGERLNVLYADGHVADVARADVLARFGGSTAGPTIARPPDAARDARIAASQDKLRQIDRALQIYSNEHRAIYPPDFGTLYTQGLAPETFVNPRGSTPPPPAGATDEQKVAWINASTDYVFRAAGRPASRFGAGDVLAYENPADMAAGINVLFGDGRVEFREMRWALETIGLPRP